MPWWDEQSFLAAQGTVHRWFPAYRPTGGFQLTGGFRLAAQSQCGTRPTHKHNAVMLTGQHGIPSRICVPTAHVAPMLVGAACPAATAPAASEVVIRCSGRLALLLLLQHRRLVGAGGGCLSKGRCCSIGKSRTSHRGPLPLPPPFQPQQPTIQPCTAGPSLLSPAAPPAACTCQQSAPLTWHPPAPCPPARALGGGTCGWGTVGGAAQVHGFSGMQSVQQVGWGLLGGCVQGSRGQRVGQPAVPSHMYAYLFTAICRPTVPPTGWRCPCRGQPGQAPPCAPGCSTAQQGWGAVGGQPANRVL